MVLLSLWNHYLETQDQSWGSLAPRPKKRSYNSFKDEIVPAPSNKTSPETEYEIKFVSVTVCKGEHSPALAVTPDVPSVVEGKHKKAKYDHGVSIAAGEPQVTESEVNIKILRPMTGPLLRSPVLCGKKRRLYNGTSAWIRLNNDFALQERLSKNRLRENENAQGKSISREDSSGPGEARGIQPSPQQDLSTLQHRSTKRRREDQDITAEAILAEDIPAEDIPAEASHVLSEGEIVQSSPPKRRKHDTVTPKEDIECAMVGSQATKANVAIELQSEPQVLKDIDAVPQLSHRQVPSPCPVATKSCLHSKTGPRDATSSRKVSWASKATLHTYVVDDDEWWFLDDLYK